MTLNNNINNNILKNIIVKYKNILKEKNFDTYSLDVELLLMHSTNLSKTDLYLNPNYELTSSQLNLFEDCFNRRLKKEPIAYILGKWEFMGLEFLLDSNTLIPRPETELLVETTLEIINNLNLNNINILDMCTGSGAIAIALAKYINISNTSIVASDLNKKALDMAKQNAKLNNVNNIKFVESDLFNNLDVNNKFNIIVSNPPYIKSSDIPTLEANVKEYEPVLALDGGKSGLIFYEQIVANSKNYFNNNNNNLNNNYLIFEIGYNQAEDLKNMLLKNGFDDNNIKIIKDFSNLDRVVVAKI
ncbi:MAG: peptide chain release factor N(5)-glutamine methyltransferase [bacterium]